jgi:Flp pilus assembly pilin Flp
MKNIMKRLWKEEEGQDMIEYALLLAFIALAAAALFPAMGLRINAIFTQAGLCLSAAGC